MIALGAAAPPPQWHVDATLNLNAAEALLARAEVERPTDPAYANDLTFRAAQHAIRATREIFEAVGRGF